MKIYYITYQTVECGQLEAFSSKSAAESRLIEMRREHREWKKAFDAAHKEEDYYGPDHVNRPYDALEDIEISTIEFPITKAGLLRAMEFAGAVVPK